MVELRPFLSCSETRNDWPVGMPETHSIEKIRECLPSTVKILDAIHAGFIEYCKGRVVVAPISHLKFDSHAQHPGDCCIKSGYVRGQETFVVKVASGFPNNSSSSGGRLSNSQGCMLVFSQKTGELRAVLADGGELTDIRTAAAACVSCRSFAPAKVETIGFLGAGVVGSLTGLMLKKLFPDAKLVAWSRTAGTAANFKSKMQARGWGSVTIAKDPGALSQCDIVITSTPSEQPLLTTVKPGALVVAIGADAKGKRELGPLILRGACVVCDSKSQCLQYGEVCHAVAEGIVKENGVAELGVLLAGSNQV